MFMKIIFISKSWAFHVLIKSIPKFYLAFFEATLNVLVCEIHVCLDMHSLWLDYRTAALQRQTDRQAIPARCHQGGAHHSGGETTVWTAVPPGTSPWPAEALLLHGNRSELHCSHGITYCLMLVQEGERQVTVVLFLLSTDNG